MVCDFTNGNFIIMYRSKREQVLSVTYLLPFQDDLIDMYCKCSVNDSVLCC